MQKEGIEIYEALTCELVRYFDLDKYVLGTIVDRMSNGDVLIDLVLMWGCESVDAFKQHALLACYREIKEIEWFAATEHRWFPRLQVTCTGNLQTLKI